MAERGTDTATRMAAALLAVSSIGLLLLLLVIPDDTSRTCYGSIVLGNSGASAVGPCPPITVMDANPGSTLLVEGLAALGLGIGFVGLVAAWARWPTAHWLLGILLVPVLVVAAVPFAPISLFVVPVLFFGCLVVVLCGLRSRIRPSDDRPRAGGQAVGPRFG